MKEGKNNIRPNSWKAWMLAMRPKTLTGAAAPVLLGGGLAVDYLSQQTRLDISGYLAIMKPIEIDWCHICVPFCLALLFALLMQITANLVNDWFDFKKGADREDRLGPERACAQGWIRPATMKRGVIISSTLSLLIGLPLIYYGGWEMLTVGVACVVFCWLYTTHLSYIGLGDVLVVVFFGVVPVVFTFYVMTGEYTLEAFICGLAMGICTDCLLLVNNYRDIEQDRQSGKRTLVVRIGKKAGLQLYLWCGLLSAALLVSVLKWWSFALIIYLALHITTYLSMRKKAGRELNQVLGATARNIFVFGLLTAVLLFI